MRTLTGGNTPAAVLPLAAGLPMAAVLALAAWRAAADEGAAPNAARREAIPAAARPTPNAPTGDRAAAPAADAHALDEAAFRWFSAPLEVSGLPAGAREVPVSCPVDFTGLLADVGAAGAIDERTIRLQRLGPDGAVAERPVQFDAAEQPRPKARRLLPGTAENVSYLSEHVAGSSPPGVRSAGLLRWIVAAAADGSARYRLRFGVPRGGRLVQVPYPPHNLRGFDDAGRATPPRWFPRMHIRPLWPLDGVLHVRDGDGLVTTCHVGPTRPPADDEPLALRRPFLYPVIGPDGSSLTEVGKPHDPAGSHAHHRSVWIAHASVGGQDFWSQRGGVIAHDGFDAIEDGPVACRIVQRTRWLAGGKTLLRERRGLTFHAGAEDVRLIDIELELAAPAAEPVTLGKTNFGFLAVRVAASMTVFDGGGQIRNAPGDRNEQGAHTKRAEWIDLSGPVASGRWAGIAILDHPGNVNHPTAWHCRNDGWAGASFNMDGPATIEPGKPLRLRYRLVLHRGDAEAADVARRFAEYRAEPTIRLGKPQAA